MMMWKLLALATLCTTAVVLIFSQLESKDDLIPLRELVEEAHTDEGDGDDLGVDPLPLTPQTYALMFTPVISGNFDPPFGPYFDDAVRPPYHDFTLSALSESDRADKQVAVQVAHDWIMSNQQEIFNTIFLLQYAEPEIKNSIELIGIESAIIGEEGPHSRSYNSTMRMLVKETTAGSAHAREIRGTLKNNVQSGGDTYECNDWGDVQDPKSGTMIRVSFSNMPVDWDPPLPKKQCKQPTTANLYPKIPYTFHHMM